MRKELTSGSAHIFLILVLLVFACTYFLILYGSSVTYRLQEEFRPHKDRITKDESNRLKYNQLVNYHRYDNSLWHTNFTVPNPPPNHKSAVELLYYGIPGMKYVSTEEVIPDQWIEYSNQALKFRYPAEYEILPISNQRLLVYENTDHLNSGQECMNKYNSYLRNDCPKPLVTLRYNSKTFEEPEHELMHRAAFYSLDNREWLVSTPENPVNATNIIATTTTDKNIFEVSFDRYNQGYFEERYQKGGDSFRDEMYKILSTIEITDDNKATHYTYVKNPTNTEYFFFFPVEQGPQMEKVIRYFGLDYLDNQDKSPICSQNHPGSIEGHPICAIDSTRRFFIESLKLPTGLVQTGEFEYDGIEFSVKAL